MWHVGSWEHVGHMDIWGIGAGEAQGVGYGGMRCMWDVGHVGHMDIWGIGA